MQVILQVAKAVESTSGIAYRPKETEPDTTESLESNETEINEAGATDAFQPRIPAGIVESED